MRYDVFLSGPVQSADSATVCHDLACRRRRRSAGVLEKNRRGLMSSLARLRLNPAGGASRGMACMCYKDTGSKAGSMACMSWTLTRRRLRTDCAAAAARMPQMRRSLLHRVRRTEGRATSWRTCLLKQRSKLIRCFGNKTVLFSVPPPWVSPATALLQKSEREKTNTKTEYHPNQQQHIHTHTITPQIAPTRLETRLCNIL